MQKHDDLTPEVRADLDHDMAMDAERERKLVDSWERTLAALKGNSKALARLDQILNHTLTSDDGETLFIPASDAAEVYTIMFMVWSAGASMLDDLVRYMGTEKDSAITGFSLVKVKSETDDMVQFEDAGADTPVSKVLIETDWT